MAGCRIRRTREAEAVGRGAWGDEGEALNGRGSGLKAFERRKAPAIRAICAFHTHIIYDANIKKPGPLWIRIRGVCSVWI